GDTERVGRLFDAESTEETHFDHLCGPRVECRELSERALERDDIDTGIGRGDIETVDGEGRFTRAALRRLPRARDVDEHPPHHRGRGGEEVRAVLPVDV